MDILKRIANYDGSHGEHSDAAQGSAYELMEDAAQEIIYLRRKLEYAYRVVNAGFTFGSFDFSILKKEAAEFVSELDTTTATADA